MASKVYFTDFRTYGKESLPHKLQRLIRAAGLFCRQGKVQVAEQQRDSLLAQKCRRDLGIAIKHTVRCQGKGHDWLLCCISFSVISIAGNLPSHKGEIICRYIYP